jgi:hypothetical protein
MMKILKQENHPMLGYIYSMMDEGLQLKVVGNNFIWKVILDV